MAKYRETPTLWEQLCQLNRENAALRRQVESLTKSLNAASRDLARFRKAELKKQEIHGLMQEEGK